MKITVPYIISGLSVLMNCLPANVSADNNAQNDGPQIKTAVVASVHDDIDSSYVALPTSPRAVDVIVKGNRITYLFDDSTRVTRIGGTLAWRSNNPGCIRDSEIARNSGAIGRVRGFAVFPDESDGMAAITKLLRCQDYINLTIAQAIWKYAPPHENDTRAYQRKIGRLTGLPTNKYIRDLSTEQLQRVANAIRRIEGWTPGREVIDSTGRANNLVLNQIVPLTRAGKTR